MIQRKALSYLKTWALDKEHKPMVLRGARQVGKTTLVKEFSKDFEVFLHLNLDKLSDKKLFDDFSDIHLLLDAIFVHNKKRKGSTSVLLFIDEIQNSSKAVAMLRYFYEETPWLYVIAAGSLLESMLDNKISFPVGRVEYLAIHPCSFVEFLGGIGETFDQELVENIGVIGVHDRLMQHFKTYALVGGMPGVIRKYIEHRDIIALERVYESLLNSYGDDVEKYAQNHSMTQIIRFLIKEGWLYAAETISFENFGKTNYKSREVGEAFRTLEKTMLLELVYPTSSVQLPLLTSHSRRPKLIWLDTGLVNYIAGVRKELFSVSDIQEAWRGRIAEQIVAQELLANQTRVSAHRNFWVRDKNQSSAEVDFVIEFGGKIIPIEVKTGSNARLRSLHQFMDRTNHDIAIRIWSNPFSIDNVKTNEGKEFRLFNIPFYYVGMIEKILSSK